MDPTLLKKLGMITYMAPADELGGGGEPDDGTDAGEEDDVEADDQEDDEDEDDQVDDDQEDDVEDDDETGGDEEEDDDADLGTRAQKRIGKLVKERNSANAEVKRLKGELENAKKLSGDDGRAIMAAATRTGILPGLMTKDEAEAFSALENYPIVLNNYQDWLDDHGPDDEFGDGEDAMSYGAVKKRVRKLNAEYEDLKDEYGGRQKDLRAKVRKIFELGLKAYRKGEEAETDEDRPKGKKPKGKQKPAVPPRGKKPLASGKNRAKWGDVTSSDSLARMIAAQQGV